MILSENMLHKFLYAIAIIAAFLIYFQLFPQHQLLDWLEFIIWIGIVALPLIISALMVRPKALTERWGKAGFIMTVLTYIPVITAALIYAINVSADHSPSVSHKQLVVSKHESRSSKSTHYYISVRDWRGEGKRTVDISVDSNTYRDTQPGIFMDIRTRHGALGFDYIERYQ